MSEFDESKLADIGAILIEAEAESEASPLTPPPELDARIERLIRDEFRRANRRNRLAELAREGARVAAGVAIFAAVALAGVLSAEPVLDSIAAALEKINQNSEIQVTNETTDELYTVNPQIEASEPARHCVCGELLTEENIQIAPVGADSHNLRCRSCGVLIATEACRPQELTDGEDYALCSCKRTLE